MGDCPVSSTECQNRRPVSPGAMETGGHAPPLVGDAQHEDTAHNLTADKILKQEVTRSPIVLTVATEGPVATAAADELSAEERAGEDLDEDR